MFEDNSYKAHEVHNDLYEALQKSLELDYSNQRLAHQKEARKKKRNKCAALRTPSGSPPSPPPPPPPPAAAQELSLIDSLMQDNSIPDEQVHLFDDEDSGNDHLPKADSRQDWSKPLPEEKIPATPELAWTIPSSNTGDITTFMKWYCRQVNKTTLTQADFKGQAYEVVKAFYPDVIHLQKRFQRTYFPVDFEDLKFASSARSSRSSSWFTQTDAIYCCQAMDPKLGDSTMGYEFKHDYTIIKSPRAVVFLVDNNDRKIMRFNEIYKFSDGTLTRILEALDYRVKEFKVKQLNPECFVGGRVRDIDYRLLQRTE
ncbi:hypothetical protein Tco_1317124 [Tanacetum coccineum]